jgi:ribonuclease HII
MKSNVEKYLKIYFIHKFALDFDLKIKDSKYLSENDKKETLEVLKEKMKSFSIRVQIESQTLRSKEPVKKK